MAAILKSAMLDSDTAILVSNTLLSSLRFTQNHSHSILTLTQTNSIWLTWWWQPSWIQPFCTKKNFTHSFCHLEFSHFAQKKTSLIHSAIMDSVILHKDTSLIHSNSTWWWQPSWILPCWIQTLPSWIQTPYFLLSDSLKNTLTPLWLWLKLIQSDSNSFILTQRDDGSHLEFCQFAFGHLSLPSQTHSLLPKLVPTICIKKPWLIHSDSTWWWQLSWSLPSWIQPFLHKKNFTHSFRLNLMMAAILNSAILDSDTAILDSDTAILDSDTLLSSLRFIQKHSHSILTLTQTNSIWLKLIHSHLTWWWQASWILPSWIQTLPSRIQTPCYLLSDSLKNTLTPLWLRLTLIQSD